MDGVGIWREADRERLNLREGIDAWSPIAMRELRDTARRYHAVITYKELGAAVQEGSGVRTKLLLQNWIGKLLEDVARIAKDEREPPLTSLCVRQNGTIGGGYARAPKSTDDQVGEDIEMYAAQHRLLCYRRYASDLPDDGGVPALTREEKARRSRPAPRADVVRPLCPVHYMELSAAGTCALCE